MAFIAANLKKTTPSQLQDIQERYTYQSTDSFDDILAEGYFLGAFDCSACFVVVDVTAGVGWLTIVVDSNTGTATNQSGMPAAGDVSRVVESDPASEVATLGDAIALVLSGGILVGGKVNTLEYHAGTVIGGNSYVLRDAGSSGARPAQDVGSIIHIDASTTGLYFEGLFPNGVTPEQFGLVGDYVFSTHTGTDNTVQARRLFNYLSGAGIELRLSAGRKYLTDTIYLGPYDNADYQAKAGRVKVTGPALGIATGDIEPQGSGFAHKNGSADKLFSIRGVYEIENPGNSGRAIKFDNVMLIGGNATTDILYIEDSHGSIALDDTVIRIRNSAGNGLTQKTVWDITTKNVFIRGDADPDDPTKDATWTGIGHNILSGTSNGQVNMNVHLNMNIYKTGYGRRVGRRAETSGTFGPIVITGGQVSNCQQEGEWLDGGVIAFTSIGHQFEACRLSGLRLDSNGANDLPRGIKYSSPYFTENGKIEDGSNESFAINIVDSVGVDIDMPVFQNAGNGILINCTAGASNTVINKPMFRTIRAYGLASGVGVKLVGGSQGEGRTKVIKPIFNQNFFTNFTDASNTLAASNAGGRLSISGNSATPSILKGGTTGSESVRIANFNNSSATTVTNITGGIEFQELTVTFSNTNTTIANNANILLKAGANYTPPTSKHILKLYYQDSQWKEI